MQNLHLPEYSAEAFRCHVHHFQYLAVPVELVGMKFVFRFMVVGIAEVLVLPGPPSIENGAHGTEALLLKSQVSEDFAT